MSSNPRFSIITPSFNQAKFIRDTIESVLQQDYENFEHIVIDGGSTDGTIDVLRDYPHLRWISEKDGGQADAINKGLRLVRGDVIGWINSDDWYAKDVFRSVQGLIRQHPVIIGECSVVDLEKNEIERVPNIARTRTDILKYWIPYSIPTQPAVFFSREVLNSVRLDSRRWVDESLHYTMDFDLFLRMFSKFEFFKIDQLFAYYRMYETNKTGQGMAPLKPEMSQIFKRHEQLRAVASDIGFVILETGDDKERTIRSIRELYGEEVPLQFVPASVPGLWTDAVNRAVHLLDVRCVWLVQAGIVFDRLFRNEVESRLAQDELGILLYLPDIRHVFSQIIQSDNLQPSIHGLLELELLPWNFGFRKTAWEDFGGLYSTKVPLLAQRILLLSAIYKGWGFGIVDAPLDRKGRVSEADQKQGRELHLQIVAEIIRYFTEWLKREPFAKERQRHGMTLFFDDEGIETANALLAQSPRL